MQKNILKEKLRGGQAVLGTELTEFLSIEVVPLLHSAGLEFFFIDAEHGLANYQQIQTLSRAGRITGVTPLVRVTQNEYALIARTLDAGAMGIIVPRVSTSRAASAAIKCLKFPPEGKRGFGLRGNVTDFRFTNAEEEMRSANLETLTILQIETREGLECVEDIALLPGVDVLMIGPFDLTISLGIPGRFDSAVFWEAVDRTIAACEKAHIAAGVAFADMKLLRECENRGMRWLCFGNEVTVLLQGYRDAVASRMQAKKTAEATG